jgi:putative transposase
VTYPKSIRRSVLNYLEAVQAVRGSVPRALVEELAEDVGCSPSTIWGWWSRHLPDHGPQPELTAVGGGVPEPVMEVLFSTGGNVSRAHRELLKDPDTAALTPPRRTLAHWWSQVDAAVRAYASHGAVGLMDQQMRVRHSVDERNQLWRADHQEYPVWVLPAGRTSRPVKPWVTTIIDDATRVLMSVLVTVERPDATSVTVSLADAMRPKSTTMPGVMLGGVPMALLNDNGGEFRSEQVLGMLKRLGIASQRTYPYMKHLNGKAERVQQTMQQELAQRLPGWSEGPKTLRLKDVYGLDGALISEELLVELILGWVDFYNSERPHQALDGATPLQAWAAQHTPIRKAEPEQVRLAMMPAANARKVTPDGVSFRGQLYTSGELARLRMVGRKVDVRYLPHDPSFIEVFDGDTWLCTCVPVDKLDADGLELMAQVRKEQYTTARAYQDAARERRELAVATATPDQPALLPLSAPRPASLFGGDEDLLLLAEAGVDAGGEPDGQLVVDVGHHQPDPWELTGGERLDQLILTDEQGDDQ